MLRSQALDIVHNFTPQALSRLSDLLSPELIDECLADTGTVTLQKAQVVDGNDGLGGDRHGTFSRPFDETAPLTSGYPSAGEKALCCARRGCAGPAAIWIRCCPVNV